MQGCIYSKEKIYVYNTNSNLLHWDKLTDVQKENNIKFVINTLINSREKDILNDNNNIYKNVIIEYNFRPNLENGYDL